MVKRYLAGTLLDMVVSMGESPSKRAFNSQHVPKTSVINNDGLVRLDYAPFIYWSFYQAIFTLTSCSSSVNHCILIYYASLYFNWYTQYTLNIYIYYIMPLYVLLLFILFFRFLFFTVCLLYVIARMNIYAMFLLRQRRLNELII